LKWFSLIVEHLDCEEIPPPGVVTFALHQGFDDLGELERKLVAAIRVGLSQWPAGPEAAERKQKLFNDRLITLALNRLASSSQH
jgi:hypothetical protein